MANEHVVVVVGGAVAGSEVVFQLHEKGITVVCIEQNALPYGKIEDGLPRWHTEQRKKEEEKIDHKINHPLVHFVPKTQLGKDVTIDEIYKTWKPSAVLLASGAWKDRRLGIDGIDDYIGKGLYYQNPLVFWFNHYEDAHYKGPKIEIPDLVSVIGGGLASLDVMKICQIEITRRALKKRGISIDVITLEKEGIPKALEEKKLTWAELGVPGSTLFYRRRVQDMPLSEIPENTKPEQMEKFGALRQKILNNYKTKFMFDVKECHLPEKAIIENGRVTGLSFIQTKIEGGKVIKLPGTEKTYKSDLIVSSVGSIPDLIPGIPAKGETYDVKNIENGEINGMPGLYVTGNAITGKGNIRVSLMHGRHVAEKVANELVAPGKPSVTPENAEKILKRVKELQTKTGYNSDYAAWAAKQIALR